jgi:uncharacterized membrane protein
MRSRATRGNADALLRVAKEHRLLVRLKRRPGDFVCPDMVLAAAHPPDRLDSDTAGSIESVFTIGHQRRPQDPSDRWGGLSQWLARQT